MKVDHAEAGAAAQPQAPSRPFKEALSEAQKKPGAVAARAGAARGTPTSAPHLARAGVPPHPPQTRAANAPPGKAPADKVAAAKLATAAQPGAATRQRAAASAVASEVAHSARVRVDAEAKRLVSVRSENATAQTEHARARTEAGQLTREQREERTVSLIGQELRRGFEQPPARTEQPPQAAAIGAAGASTPQPPQPDPGVRAAQAVALIEKIEVFVRSQRPALQLTLNNSLGARVEIERLGPGAVALKLVGQRGPPSPEAVSRVREELQERGLKVGALSVE